jgi:hypothetical protein
VQKAIAELLVIRSLRNRGTFCRSFSSDELSGGDRKFPNSLASSPIERRALNDVEYFQHIKDAEDAHGRDPDVLDQLETENAQLREQAVALALQLQELIEQK